MDIVFIAVMVGLWVLVSGFALACDRLAEPQIAPLGATPGVHS